MTPSTDSQQSSNISLLDRFYRVFLVVCIVFLTIGVPFVFYRKAVSAGISVVMVVAVLTAWRMSRRGQPQKSLKLFAAGFWLVLVGLLFGGLPPYTAAAVLSVAVMLSVVVHFRAGVIYGASYMLAWLVYIVLQANHMVPAPYFSGATLTGWLIGAVAIWLVLLPVPELVRKLHKAASLQHAVIEAASDGILVVNTEGNVEAYNERFVQLWRIPPELRSGDDEALLGFVVQQVVEPQQFMQKVRDLYAHPDQSSFDTLLFNDGRMVERSSQPQRLDQKIVGRVWSFRDVTEKEKTQVALEHGKEQFEAILNATTESIFLVDRGGVLLAINATAALRMNHESEQLLGHCVFDYFPPSVSATRRAALEEVFRTGQVKHVEDVRGKRSFALTYYPVLGVDATVESVVVFAANITERKRAEQATLALAQRNQLLMQTATEGIHILDSEGKLVEANEAFARMLGYTPQELTQLNVAQWDAKWGEDELAGKVRDLIQHGGAFETVHRRKDGSLLDVEVHATGVCLEGQNYLYAASRDISQRKRAEAQLVAREARLSSLMAAMHDPVVVLDFQARVIECFSPHGTGHPSFRSADGVVLGKSCQELMPETAEKLYCAAIAALAADGPSQTFEYAVTDGGQEFLYMATMSRVNDADQSPAGFLTVVRDITARRTARREIERLAQRNALLLDSVGEGIFDVDPAGKATFTNPAALTMLGLTQEQMLGQDQHTLFHHRREDGSAYPLDQCPIYQVLTDGRRRQIESEWFWRQDGTGFPVSLTVTPIVDEDQRVGAVVVFRDITERKRTEAEIQRLAFHDALTMLPNRRLLIDRLVQMLATCKRNGQYGALLFLDLDNFKPLNDSQGHAVGDMLLIEVARRITRCVREIDTVARFGGDEFVVMLGELDAGEDSARQHVGRVAEKIRQVVAQPYQFIVPQNDGADSHVQHSCTSSIGIALFPDHAATADEILKQADIAMYRAKDAGRNAVRFYEPESG